MWFELNTTCWDKIQRNHRRNPMGNFPNYIRTIARRVIDEHCRMEAEKINDALRRARERRGRMKPKAVLEAIFLEGMTPDFDEALRWVIDHTLTTDVCEQISAFGMNRGRRLVEDAGLSIIAGGCLNNVILAALQEILEEMRPQSLQILVGIGPEEDWTEVE